MYEDTGFKQLTTVIIINPGQYGLRYTGITIYTIYQGNSDTRHVKYHTITYNQMINSIIDVYIYISCSST
jgi:hypothetical protein